jgi:hypothetical protein
MSEFAQNPTSLGGRFPPPGGANYKERVLTGTPEQRGIKTSDSLKRQVMDFDRIIVQLRSELQLLDEAIRVLERPAPESGLPPGGAACPPRTACGKREPHSRRSKRRSRTVRHLS